tara:strand:+ start:7523 stop:8596 length:1074 start_codon:yes stop_codon:yes gene_type:complete
MLELDAPEEVRKEEAIDIKKISSILNKNLGFSSKKLIVKQYRKGFSNLTYNISWNNNEFILRRPPLGKVTKGGHDMQREYEILSKLSKHYDKVPKTYLYFNDKKFLEYDFYLMEKLEGIILRPNTPNELMPDKSSMENVSKIFIKTLSSLHKLDYKKLGLENFKKGNGYSSRQIFGWSKRYLQSKTNEIKEMDFIINWLSKNQKSKEKFSLIHNDYKYDNIVLNKDYSKILGILDWEMATIGNPMFDLGTTLGYWIQSNDHPLLKKISLSPTTTIGNFSRMEIVNFYEKYSQIEVKDPVYYYVFGLFKISVIVQQIYFRYKSGYSKDLRFSKLIEVVRTCSIVAYQAIKKNKIDDLF